MEQMPEEILTVLTHSGESVDKSMEQPGNGTRPRGLLAGIEIGLLAGIETVTGEGDDMLQPCTQVVLVLA